MNERKVDLFFMRLFRDLGRFKAQKRRQRDSQEKNSLMIILLQKDDPMKDLLLLDAEEEDESNLPTYTPAELFEFGSGEQETEDGEAILLISIYGRVYDVTKGKKYYGEDGRYGLFVGHDVTYSLATGCRTDLCLDKKGYTLTDKEQSEGKRWLSFFHLHDKYPLVGKLEGDHFEDLLNQLIEEDEGFFTKNESGGGQSEPHPPINVG
eukprot:CAMPEP_0198153242 /NCGR_PEP_ID=MMETSP1443-20131203/63289_1 /TAXON_ID=186043 /ORGANISM="Entomoneis sp., Strain CCMP2396" /LENGTH=207 /DNA_ID=CAMNT_0043819503 /DNA_START=51 /DNA_END=674 /DNA_ORIENTATION=+